MISFTFIDSMLLSAFKSTLQHLGSDPMRLSIAYKVLYDDGLQQLREFSPSLSYFMSLSTFFSWDVLDWYGRFWCGAVVSGCLQGTLRHFLDQRMRPSEKCCGDLINDWKFWLSLVVLDLILTPAGAAISTIIPDGFISNTTTITDDIAVYISGSQAMEVGALASFLSAAITFSPCFIVQLLNKFCCKRRARGSLESLRDNAWGCLPMPSDQSSVSEQQNMTPCIV